MTAATGTASGFRRRAGVLRHDNFRLLFFATLGSGVGNWMATIALTGGSLRPHGPLRLVGQRRARSSTSCPAIAIGLLFGPLVDRLSRKGLMIASDLVRLGRLRRAVVRAQPGRDRRPRGRRRHRQRDSSARPSSRACPTWSTTGSSPTPTRSCSSPNGLRPPVARCSQASSSPPRARTWSTGSTRPRSPSRRCFVAWIPAGSCRASGRSGAATGATSATGSARSASRAC